MQSMVFFLAVLAVVFFVLSLRKMGLRPGKPIWIIVLFVLPVAVRFAPLLVGLEWRATIRFWIEGVVAVVLALWCVVYAAYFKQQSNLPLLVATALLSACMLMNVAFYPVKESVAVQNGVPSYVRENSDSGSLAGVQHFHYVNEAFRSLLPLYNLSYNLQSDDHIINR